MKLEILKDKGYKDLGYVNKQFDYRDVKSAVGWLKSQFIHSPNCRTKIGINDCTCDYELIINKINMAFEDVIDKD